MKTIALLVLCLSLLTTPAFARLGESLEQLKARFGAPSPYSRDANVFAQGRVYPIGKIWSFASGEWSITCTLIKDACVQITYSKRSDLTDDQIKTLLGNEAQGSTWTEVHDYATTVNSIFMPMMKVRKWKRSDGTYASRTGNEIVFTTPDYDKAVTAAQQQGQAESQKMPSNL